MPPTDKALAVMTEIDALTIETLCIMPLLGVNTRAALERRILPLVRYLVDHPERLAGEGQVIVDGAEIERWKRAYEHDTEFAPHDTAYGMICRWLAGSPTAQEEGE